MSKNSFNALLLCFTLLLSGLSFAEETVRIGDLVQVDLPGEPSLNKGFQVDKRGRITLRKSAHFTWRVTMKANFSKRFLML